MAEPEDGAYHRAVTQGSGRAAARSTAIVDRAHGLLRRALTTARDRGLLKLEGEAVELLSAT